MNNNNYNLLSFSKKVNNTTISYNEHIETIQDIEDNFKWLEEQVLQNNRQISVLDFYNIAGSTDKDRINTDYNLLLKNSSLLLTSPVSFNGEDYAVGDMVYKQENGVPMRLQLGGGTYYPIIKASTIEWKYTKDSPTPNLDPKESYTIDLIDNQTVGAGMYGEIKQPSGNKKSVSFPIRKKNTDIIPPVIKFFHKYNNNTWEEVFWDDFILESDTTTFKIENIPTYINWVVVK